MPLFRQEAIDHKRRKLYGEVILVQPVKLFVITVVMFAVTLALIGFLMTGEYKRKETVAGYIQPANGLSIIRADQGGRLTQVFVNEGDIIEAGTPLFESRVDVDTQDGPVSERRLEALDTRLSELEGQLEGITIRYRAERTRLQAQITHTEDELSGLRRRHTLQSRVVALASSRLEQFERLTKEDVTSKLELDSVREGDINARLSLEAIAQQIISRESALTELRHTLRGLKGSEARELSQIRLQISQLHESRSAMEAAVRYLVRSPVSGTVTALQGKAGQSVPPNAPIVMIIPEQSELIATLLAPTRAAGFLEPGQDVNLLIDAFPYQKFGVHQGIIRDISDTPFRPGELDAPIPFEQAVYRVNVALDKQTVLAYGKDVDLKTGMTLQGDLITDRRTLLQWMLDPLFTLRRE